jgi:chitin disaccharide deacetylase
MPARLILNADDFGLTPGINRAIAELHTAGALTSATLMANGPAFEDAASISRTHPTLGVGCHIVLTDGLPVSPAAEIPSLIGPDGKSFRPTLTAFLRALFLGHIRAQDVAREALAQIEKLQQAGIAISHVDTHKHTHLFPSITRPLLEVAGRANIRAIRNPFEPHWSLALHQGSPTRRLAINAINRLRPQFEAALRAHAGRIQTTEGTVAIAATGELDANTLTRILYALPTTGTYELCCHPGYNDRDLDAVTTRLRAHRDIEREALLREIPKLLVRPDAPQLISYAGLTSPT